jgi:hypothetical protein
MAAVVCYRGFFVAGRYLAAGLSAYTPAGLAHWAGIRCNP